MGKALQRLSFELLAVDNLDKAAEWTVNLQQFGTVFSTQLKARTYVKDVPFDQIPKSKRRNKKWWYTHYTHRGIYLGPGPRKVDTSGVSYAAWVSVADVSASKVSGARRLHQECRLRVL